MLRRGVREERTRVVPKGRQIWVPRGLHVEGSGHIVGEELQGNVEDNIPQLGLLPRLPKHSQLGPNWRRVDRLSWKSPCAKERYATET